MKKKLGIPFKTKSNYAIEQINNFDKEKTIKHVINRHQTNIEGKSQFHSNININYLFEVLTENLKNSKKANIEEMLEVHYFAISNVGINNSVCNFVKVVVIPNTNNIISIYPVDNIYDSEFTNLEYDRSKLVKEDNKVKSLSRIDKFKQKYNM